AATDSPAVNAQVAADAQELRVWCVRADEPAGSSARTPAVARAGEVTVAVTTGDPGRSTALARAVALAVDTGGLPLRRRRRSGAGLVSLVGGGPGDPGLVTVRGRR